MFARKVSASLLAFLMTTVGFALAIVDVEAEAGSADAHGYSWTDSKGGAPNVTFEWIDVQGGTDAGFSYSTNQFVGPFNIGFAFEFYGNTYSSFYISTNGFMTLGSGATDSVNDPIPSTSVPNNVIAPFWDDLMVDYSPYNSGEVYYQTMGAAPNRQLVVQWDNVSRAYSSNHLTFEVILNETGEVWFQYREMGSETGVSATVGIENIDGSVGCEYSYNEAIMENELAIRFERGPIGFGPDSSGAGNPGDVILYILTVTNGQGVVDSFDIEINSSLLGWNVSICDSMGIPLTDENNNTIPDTGNLTANDSFTIHAYVEIPMAPLARTETTILIASSYADPSVNDTAILTTETTKAIYDAPHTDVGYDDDSDGDFDYLIVNVSLYILEEDDFHVYCYLYTATEQYIQMVLGTNWLPMGSQMISVQFTGEYIFSGLENGTFTVRTYLYDSDWDFIGLDSHTTSPYNYTDFDPPEAIFFPPHSDYAIDDDSDTLYDYLVVDAIVQVHDEGEYTVEAYLEDDWGDPVSYTEHVDVLVAGTHTVQLMFPGWDINTASMDGPYYAYLYLDNQSGFNIDYNSHETGSYIRSDFEGLPVMFLPPYDDYGNDTDGDGYYNELIIEVPIDCSETGYYDIEIYIEDYYSDEFRHIFDTIHVEAGVGATYTVALDSYSIRSNGVNGRFYVDMYLYNSSTAFEYDSDSHMTDYYSLSYFDPLGAFLEPPYDDYGRDDDSDGRFDCLVVTVPINASSTGYYDLQAYVRNPYYTHVVTLEQSFYIEENTVYVATVEIDSYTICREGIDGEWYLALSIYDHWTSTQYSYDTYTTDSYNVDLFDPIPVQFEPPHADYGLDTDDDADFDYLVVQVTFSCYETGRYTFYADLYDPYMSLLTSAQVTRDCSPGWRAVEFVFDGWVIWYNGVNGWFDVLLSVEDEAGMIIDTDVHYSDYYYYYSEFEHSPAELSPPHNDIALDDDVDGLYEYLIVAVTVEVYIEGDYIVTGTLRDDWGYDVDAVGNSTHLETGTNDVELWFDGWLIALATADPWYVSLELADVQGVEMDSATYYLGAAYWRTDFNATLPTLEAGWAYDVPVIDGFVDPGEWFGAGTIAFTEIDEMNEVSAMMFVMNNDTHLFVCVDAVGDVTNGQDDSASLSFDTGNDNLITDSEEDQFVLTWMGSWTDSQHLVYDSGYWDWTDDCRPFDPGLAYHEGLAGTAGFGSSDESTTAHRIYELSIPLALLDAVPGDVLGFATASAVGLGVMDSDDYAYSAWPAHFLDEPSYAVYGDLVLSPERPMTTAEVDGLGGDNGWFVSDVDVSLSASGGTGGVNATYLRVGEGSWVEYETPIAVSGDGIHSIQYYSVDMSGVEEPVRTLDVMIDTESPETSASVEGTLGYDDWYTANALALFEAIDESSGVRAIMARLDGGAWMNVSEGFMDITEDGIHQLEYYAVDVAGHEEDVKSIELKVDLNAPETMPYVEGSRVTLNVTDSGSGVSTTLYRIDGGEWKTYAGPFEVRGEGNHTVEFFSRDAAGNNETVKSIVVEGAAGVSILGMDLWLALLMLALLVAIILGVLFVFLRRTPRPPRGYPMPPDARLYEQQEPPQVGVGEGEPPRQGQAPPPTE